MSRGVKGWYVLTVRGATGSQNRALASSPSLFSSGNACSSRRCSNETADLTAARTHITAMPPSRSRSNRSNGASRSLSPGSRQGGSRHACWPSSRLVSLLPRVSPLKERIAVVGAVPLPTTAPLYASTRARAKKWLLIVGAERHWRHGDSRQS